MSHPNLPHTPFPDRGDRRPVARVHAVAEEHGPAQRDDVLNRLPSDGRIVRVRALPGRDAAGLIASWCTGATPLGAPAPWRAWERVRADAASGAPRVQRLAVAPGDPAVVVNWSVTAPLDRADAGHWERTLEHAAGAARVPAPPTPGEHAWRA